MQNPPTVHGELLSRDDERAAISEVLIDRLPHKGKLIELPNSFYDQLTTDDGIKSAVRELYRWLGSKPSGLRVEFTEDATISQKDHALFIPKTLLQTPYQLASNLTLFVVSNVLEARFKDSVQPSLAETASIESGLGAIILNGTASEIRPIQHWYDGIIGRSTNPHVLESYSPRGYAEAHAAHCHILKLQAQTITTQLSEQAVKLLPPYYRNQSSRHRSDPVVTLDHKQKARHGAYKLAAISGIIGVLCALGLFVYSQRPYKPSESVTAQYTKTQVLARSYDDCASEAKKLQNNYKQDDIFLERQINAALAKCQSIRNQYNYEVSVYNDLVSKTK